MYYTRFFSLTLIMGSLCSAVPAAAATSAMVNQISTAAIPARTLQCVLGRGLNVKPGESQTIEEIGLEGRFEMDLFLPEAPRRTAPPPDAIEAPEPVNPATRVTRDSGNLLKDVPIGFDRVVDLWPERVEMVRAIAPMKSHLIMIDQVDPTERTARIYMTTASDALTFDLNRFYLGNCQVIESGTVF